MKNETAKSAISARVKRSDLFSKLFYKTREISELPEREELTALHF